MSSRHRSPVIVGAVVAVLFAGPAWAGPSAESSSEGSSTGPVGSSLAANKKKPSKGTLAIKVSGSGSYTVTGKGFRKTGTASKSFKVKPGTYTVKAPTGSVKPGKAKVRKGKTARVTVTFPAERIPSTPGLPSTPTPVTPPVTPPTPVTPPVTPPTPTPVGLVGSVIRLSTDAIGGQANDDSIEPAWSPDGSRIAFSSDAANLVQGDTNNSEDVFVKNLTSGVVQRVSTDATGAETNRDSFNHAWSPDGTMIAFASTASDLVPGDTNDTTDIFVKTLTTGAVQRVSTDSSGGQADGMSDRVVWSPDGTRVAFDSEASNLVSGDTNNWQDVFVKTLATGAVQRVSTDAAGAQADDLSYGPAWSPDGARIGYTSWSSNLVASDTNGKRDVFVKTLATGAVQRVSTDASGAQSSEHSSGPVWAPGGTRIAFTSEAGDLVPGDTNGKYDVFVKTLATGALERVSTDDLGDEANGSTGSPAWSPDGTRIAFTSLATDLTQGDTNNSEDVFVKNLTSGVVQRVSADALGGQAIGDSYDCAWSPDGTRIAFDSAASNLILGDTNAVLDVFVKTLG